MAVKRFREPVRMCSGLIDDPLQRLARREVPRRLSSPVDVSPGT